MLPAAYRLAQVGGVFNAIDVVGDYVGQGLFYGRGAGDQPTASAVVSDVIEIGRDLLKGVAGRVPPAAYPAEGRSHLRLIAMDEITSLYYLRFAALDHPGVLSTISGVLGTYNISISSVIQKGRKAGGPVPVVMMTHRARERDVRRALAEIDGLSAVLDKTVLIRVEGEEIQVTRWQGVIAHYRDLLPVTDRTPIVTLNEGNTPLIETKNLAAAITPALRLFLKFEGTNPTGSFKDRGMTMAISKAAEAGADAVICASTGNTSASAAAYGARAGMRVFVLIPEGKIAMGKLAQAMIHRARVIQVEGNFDEALAIVKGVAERYPVTLVNSINPFRLEGQKTAAFEVCDQLEGAPDVHALPVGNAGNITAYWRGYREYHANGRADRLPRMVGFQAAGAAPIVLGHVVEKPRTIATAIRIGNPASWKTAVEAAAESKDQIDLVTDDEIIEAYRMIANRGRVLRTRVRGVGSGCDQTQQSRVLPGRGDRRVHAHGPWAEGR
jgi:threonine synthase